MATSLFAYNSGSVTNPLSYTKIALPPGCVGAPNICTIFAETQLIGGAQRPIITPSLSTEISIANSTGIPTANVELKF